MFLRFNFYCLFVFIVLVTGCASNSRYEWSNYDAKLYDHYKDPSQKEQFFEAIKETLAECEAAGKVPPGIYAEYGFLLYEQGNSLMAIQYYQKEADRWPESRSFMSKMIANAQKRSKKQNTPAQQATTPDSVNQQIETKPTEVVK